MGVFTVAAAVVIAAVIQECHSLPRILEDDYARNALVQFAGSVHAAENLQAIIAIILFGKRHPNPGQGFASSSTAILIHPNRGRNGYLSNNLFPVNTKDNQTYQFDR